MKEVKAYPNCLNYDHIGDFVRCSDCGNLLLIQIGGAACCTCKSENLQWYDENKLEWSIDELIKEGFNIVEFSVAKPYKSFREDTVNDNNPVNEIDY